MCGSPEHPAWKAHVFKPKAGIVVANRKMVKVVANVVANKRSKDRHKKTSKRAAYMRDLMRSRRT